jgi:cysteine-rich repeat protein
MKHLGWIALLLLAACEGGGSINTGPVCGDGLREGAEACDDGNIVGGDGCSATCAIESTCGNDVVEPGEDCDGTADCTDECTLLAQMTATWTIESIDGTSAGCPPTYDTAAVYSQEVDASGNNIGSPIIDLFDCADSTGQVLLDPGNYRVWIAITTANNSQTYAQSLSAFVDLTTTDQTFSASILTDGGYFQLAWNLVGANSSLPLTCTEAASNGVELVSTLSGPNTMISDIWNCEDGSAITGGLAAGTYTLSVAALDASDGSIGTAPTLTNKVIMGPNKVTDLGTIEIPIDGQ